MGKLTNPFAACFDAIKSLEVSEATEHTLRGPLETLLKAMAADAGPGLRVIHEPKRDPAGLGAPDFKVKRHEAILGYVENKRVGADLDAVLQSDQLAKYRKLSGNMVLTNYLEWIWLKDGEVNRRETLCSASAVGNRQARLDPDRAHEVAALVAAFLSTPPEKLGNARKLSEALAVRCHDLRDFLLDELARQDAAPQKGRLYGLYDVFRRDVFHELELGEFADAFAQTLGYGLFLAKLNAGERTPVTLHNTKRYVPAHFALIRELVDFLDELEQEEYRGIRWLVEEILSIMNTLDLAAVLEDLAFTKPQARPADPVEEERLLFAKDPYVYFYEDFLKAYDRETRKARGVYYTPPPVVNFIVRAVDDILKETFGIAAGLADRKRVTVLDFATGTGTFLLEVLQRIFETTAPGVRGQVVREHVLKNLYGFEYLIAPYTIAHLKLSQFLHDRGYAMQSGERLQIYLTNALEPIEAQANWLLPALSREVEAAQQIKDNPILVITGNPPYAGHSRNTGAWITEKINAYKTVDGKPLGERNLKWLQDDYVKFVRFAQWKMEQAEEGVVGIVTNHSFLDNPTFRGMRQSLMQTFHRLYVLDLHGSTRKKERTPEGGKDKNVFDIEQGVAVSLLVKKKGLQRGVYHADLWGQRTEKYRALLEAEKDTVEWTELNPSPPFHLFIPQDEELRDEYERGWKVTDIFIVKTSGIVSKRDSIAFHFEKETLYEVLKDFDTLDERALRERYKFKDSRDGKISFVKKHIQDYGVKDDYIRSCLYGPFDFRWTYYTDRSKGFLGWPVYDVMRHMLSGKNLGLCVSKGKEVSTRWEHVFCTDHLMQHHAVSQKEVNYLIPLYLYAPPENRKRKDGLFKDGDPFNGKDRIENFSPRFRAFVRDKYKHGHDPEDILGYVYAMLHSPSYREKYRDFLKIDFPRVPFVEELKTFEALSGLGRELIQAHLLKTIPQSLTVDAPPGDFTVKKLVYEPRRERLHINEAQYFSPVPQDVWDFHIGGYRVLDKYLKSRKGRTLSLDEIETVQAVVNVLRFTIDQMQRIDACWSP